MRVLITVTVLLISMPIYADDIKGKSSPRLKFKNGPVCMCSEGLSEKDIRASLEARQGAGKDRLTKKIQQDETSRSSDEEDK